MSIIKTSPECMVSVCAIGGIKGKTTFINGSIMGFLGGAYIGLGGLFAIKLAGNMPIEIWGNMTRLVFAFAFPLGLLMVMIAGADLFTGNCMYLPSAMIGKKTGWGGLARSWGLSYASNFVGAVFVAYFLGYSTTLFLDLDANGFMPLAAYTVKLANGKCILPFDVAFWRGVGCNWMVCIAIYMSLAASDGVSKAVLLWPPVVCFVAMGFEHSVANMTFIPLAIFIGNSDIYLNNAVPLPSLTADWYGLFIKNLIPVTLGNIVGAAVFIGMAYYKANNLKVNSD